MSTYYDSLIKDIISLTISYRDFPKYKTKKKLRENLIANFDLLLAYIYYDVNEFNNLKNLFGDLLIIIYEIYKTHCTKTISYLAFAILYKYKEEYVKYLEIIRNEKNINNLMLIYNKVMYEDSAFNRIRSIEKSNKRITFLLLFCYFCVKIIHIN